ncbi:MAG TPA: hypothetical protein ENI05_11025 [Porticoccus sp.]|nr:hypothetical protein [Porticoccus sp.]
MTLTIILIILVAFLSFKLPAFFKPARKTSKKNALKNRMAFGESTPHINNLYHAVNIKFDLAACPAIQSMANDYFLAGDAPPIPLPACTSAACRCKYIHHKGRRHSIRRPQAIIATEAYGSTGKLERRMNTGRRETD